MNIDNKKIGHCKSPLLTIFPDFDSPTLPSPSSKLRPHLTITNYFCSFIFNDTDVETGSEI